MTIRSPPRTTAMSHWPPYRLTTCQVDRSGVHPDLRCSVRLSLRLTVVRQPISGRLAALSPAVHHRAPGRPRPPAGKRTEKGPDAACVRGPSSPPAPLQREASFKLAPQPTPGTAATQQ